MVPNIKAAETLDFKQFWVIYEELVHRARTNRLTPDDFAGTTATLTNPGTIGTIQSVPRLMPDQGVIVGVGRHQLPDRVSRRRRAVPGPSGDRPDGHPHLHL